MRRFAISAFLCAISLAVSAKAWAWGCQGHQVVAYIAYQHMSDQAKKQVDSILGNDPSGDYTKPLSGADACGTTTPGGIETYSTWADATRPTGADWHFWDVPLAVKTATASQYCGGGGCIITALVDQIKALQSSTLSDDDKHKALMYIIHFLGDLHQPMHIVDNGDRGGNCVPVKFEGTNTKGESDGSYDPNLHSIWDTNLISAGSK